MEAPRRFDAVLPDRRAGSGVIIRERTRWVGSESAGFSVSAVPVRRGLLRVGGPVTENR